MSTSTELGLTAMSIDARDALSALEQAIDCGSVHDERNLSIGVRQSQGSLWLVFAIRHKDALAFRLFPGAAELTNVSRSDDGNRCVQLDYTTSLGAVRSRIEFPQSDMTIVRCTTSLLPHSDTAVTHWPRDVYVLGGGTGTIHTAQRGLRTGILFAASHGPVPFTLFYLQDFSSLTDYAAATRKTWADTVGGRWPEIGYAPPSGEACVLPKARETVLSDAYLTVSEDVPSSRGEIAAQYLDILAAVYLCMRRPCVEYHDWPGRAEHTLRDLSLSPLCTYRKRGLHYLMPYVGDAGKPPESMVQLTLAVNVQEYDEWRASRSTLAAALCANVPSFFDEKVGAIVRWLPGQPFAESQAEENMNHEAMDSWYLHHALFNAWRLAQSGDEIVKGLFQKSLLYAIRVAQRFDYRWPIFFNLHSLDIIRAEAEPGKGGETDVAGLYALVMLHAHEMFGDAMYLSEAKNAGSRLEDLGFELAYQLNTTGFAAEAMMRLWKVTKDRKYLALSEVCVANLFDNMWLWRCDYERGTQYRPFFGLFPLRTAPYIAAYEELEAQAKAFEYLYLGGEDVRPSIRLLMAEFQKYALDRTWYYYPDALPADGLAEKPRNGRIERSLSVPIEDLQEGHTVSGQVGQEVYGAGLALVNTSRYFRRLPHAALLLYCNYPMYDFSSAGADGAASFRTGGDPRGSCEVRIISDSPDAPPTAVVVTCTAGATSVPVAGVVTPEGHAIFNVRGGQHIRVTCNDASKAAADKAVVIGALAPRPAHTK